MGCPTDAQAKAQAQGHLLAPVHAALENTERCLSSATDPCERSELLLATGRQEEALDFVPELLSGSLPQKIWAARILYAGHEWETLSPLLDQLERSDWQDSAVRALVYRFFFLKEDLRGLEGRLESQQASGLETVDLLAKARFLRSLFEHQKSQEICASLLRTPLSSDERAKALHQLGVTLYQLRDFDAALEHFLQALQLIPLKATLLVDLAHTLIRLGRTEEAISSARLAIRLAPLHETAHYLLGNGYALRNYSELEAAWPQAFAQGAQRHALEQAEAHLADGQVAAARSTLVRLARRHGALADVRAYLGAFAFSAGRLRTARLYFQAALKRCPHYGRAHNGLAKTFEAQRLRIQVHRAADEAKFAAMPAPTLPKLDQFLLNASTLSPRHAKRVALSITPWRHFLSVLIDSGATYYIKPLYQRLSETPAQELLRDRRISYDSRLWDDVRGCGGYHTVTGIEDVERTIVGGYDTVLHELTHQVHALLPAARQRQLKELYRRALARQAAGEDAFISRYAGTNVQEYLAEGTHALSRPRRDRFDRREIVAERLLKRDPELVALIRELQAGGDAEAAWVVGQVNRGSDHLRRGRSQEALNIYRRAVEHDPGEESVRGALLSALLMSGEPQAALQETRRAMEENPQSATYALCFARALWLNGEGLPTAIAHLEGVRSTVRPSEGYRLDQRLSDLYWTAGDAENAQAAAERVLATHSEAPLGLWALAQAQALHGAWAEAWTAYEAATRQRTGVTELRCDYARDLLRAGEVERAMEQVEAARLLEPEEPRVLACLAWLQQAQGRLAEARNSARRGLELGPWCDLARLRLALVEEQLGDVDAAAAVLRPWWQRFTKGQPPEYIFRRLQGRYDLVYSYPAVERALVESSPIGKDSIRQENPP